MRLCKISKNVISFLFIESFIWTLLVKRRGLELVTVSLFFFPNMFINIFCIQTYHSVNFHFLIQSGFRVTQRIQFANLCKRYHINYSIFQLTLWIVKVEEEAELVAQMCSVQKVFFEISQNSQENFCGRVSFLRNFIKKEALAQVYHVMNK